MNTPDQDRPDRPRWTLSEAARRTGTSRATLLRRIEAGKIPGATKTDSGWSIGVEDLLAAGFLPDRPAPPDPGHEHGHTPDQPPTGAAQRIAELERELAVAHAQRAAAEQVAAERERIIQAQSVTLRMLEASPPATIADEPVPPALAPLEVPAAGALSWLRKKLLP